MKKQGFVGGAVILMGMVVITKAIGMIYKIPLTNLLGGEGMAYYSGAFAVFTPVYAVAVSGIAPSVARLTADCVLAGRYSDALRLRRVSGWLFFGASAAAAGGLALLSVPLSGMFFGSRSAAAAVVLTAPVLVLSAAVSVERGFCEGSGDMLPTAASEVLETIVRAAAGLALAYGAGAALLAEFRTRGTVLGQPCLSADEAARLALPFSAAGAVAGNTLASCASFIYMEVAARRRTRGLAALRTDRDRPTKRRRTVAREVMSYAVPVSLAAAISTLAGLIDLVTVRRGISLAAGHGFSVEGISPKRLPDLVYGSYTGAVLMLAGLVPTLTAMLGKSSLPMVTEAVKKRDSALLRRRLGDVLLAGNIIACPCAALLCALPRETLLFLFPGRQTEVSLCALPLAVCGAGVLFSAAAAPCLSVLQTLGHRRTPIAAAACGAAAKLALNLLLIPMPRLNITGAAISTAASQAVMCGIAFGAVMRSSGGLPDLGRALVKPLFAGTLCGAAARTAADMAAALPPRVGFVTAAAAGGAVYLAALALMEGKAAKTLPLA
ncbi:MAG: polysaccharide biosynthesis C-terminal domain-containing protein [Ruminococcus sp.]|nr:polysaccharide biosynthesis C-terminal domain-containing protein [Ruminococcus sp.]